MHKMFFRLAVWLLKVAVGLSFAFIRLAVWLLEVAVGLSFAFIRLAWWLCWKTFDVCYTYSQRKTLTNGNAIMLVLISNCLTYSMVYWGHAFLF